MHIDIYTHDQIQLDLFCFFSPLPPISFKCTCFLISPPLSSFSPLIYFFCFFFPSTVSISPSNQLLFQTFSLPPSFFLCPISTSDTPSLFSFITLFLFSSPYFLSLPQISNSPSCSFTLALFIWWLSGWWYRLSEVGAALTVWDVLLWRWYEPFHARLVMCLRGREAARI